MHSGRLKDGIKSKNAEASLLGPALRLCELHQLVTLGRPEGSLNRKSIPTRQLTMHDRMATALHCQPGWTNTGLECLRQLVDVMRLDHILAFCMCIPLCSSCFVLLVANLLAQSMCMRIALLATDTCFSFGYLHFPGRGCSQAVSVKSGSRGHQYSCTPTMSRLLASTGLIFCIVKYGQ